MKKMTKALIPLAVLSVLAVSFTASADDAPSTTVGVQLHVDPACKFINTPVLKLNAKGDISTGPIASDSVDLGLRCSQGYQATLQFTSANAGNLALKSSYAHTLGAADAVPYRFYGGSAGSEAPIDLTKPATQKVTQGATDASGKIDYNIKADIDTTKFAGQGFIKPGDYQDTVTVSVNINV